MTNLKSYIVIAIAIASLFIAIGAIADTIDNYTKEVEVVKVIGQEVTVIDSRNNYWAFYGEGYSKGDRLIVTLDSKQTTTIYDDEVVAVERAE